MAILKELTDILKNTNLTDQQIGELLTSLTAMQKENEDAEKGKNKVVQVAGKEQQQPNSRTSGYAVGYVDKRCS